MYGIRIGTTRHESIVISVGVHPTEPTPAPITTEPQPSPSAETSMTICERLLADAQRFVEENPYSSENYVIPTCTEVGTFAPRQCKAYDSSCWCVDQDTGEEIIGTRTDPGQGYVLDCSGTAIDSHRSRSPSLPCRSMFTDIQSPDDDRTPCQIARAAAEAARTGTGSDVHSMYMPRCMESGAFEPVQQLPDGSFMCVNFDGEEVSRSRNKPQCMRCVYLESKVTLLKSGVTAWISTNYK